MTPRLCDFDAFAPEIVFRSEGVVSRAAQGEIRGGVLAAQSEWVEVVKFEAMRLGATTADGIDVGALLTIALEDGAPHRGGDVAAALVREVDFGALLNWPGFEPRLLPLRGW